MSANYIDVTFNKITLVVRNPNLWLGAKRLAGKVKEVGVGAFEYSFSTHNLSAIFNTFTGNERPVIRSGQQHVDAMRTKLIRYKQTLKRAAEICALERYPVEPNGKFVPYAHQTKIIGLLTELDFTPVGADCGVGKTGSTARAVEIALRRGDIARGKVLVTAPLSILYTSWVKDIKNFTDLNVSVLWTPMANKTLLGESKEFLFAYGEKPDGAVSVKTKTASAMFNHHTKELRKKITALDKASEWTKYEVTYKEAQLIDGIKVPFGPVTGRTAEKQNTKEEFIRNELLRTDVDVYVINHDGVRIYEELLKKHDFEWVVVDESTKIKDIKSQVSQSHINMSWGAKKRTTLSGTPTPNGMENAWAQYYFLDRGLTIHPAIADFRHEYMVGDIVGSYVKNGEKIQAKKYRVRGLEEQKKLIERLRAPGIFIKQRDCIDLPPRVDTTRVVYMGDEQAAAYKQMEKELIADLKGGDIRVEAVNILSKMMKLRQITSGFLPIGEGEVHEFKTNPKLNDLDDFIEELQEEKLVIVCQFQNEIKTLLSRYKEFGVRAIYGGVDVRDRTEAVEAFQTRDDVQLIVLQPQAASHGITLTAASKLIYLSTDYNWEYYYQVGKRIERLGQKNSMLVVNSLARLPDNTPTIDEDLLEILSSKGKDQDQLFKPEQSATDIAQSLVNNMLKRNGA